MNNIQKNNLASVIQEKHFNQNEIVFNEGDEGDSIFTIKEGSVSCRTKENQEVRKMLKNDIFGEASVLFKSKRSLKVISLEKSILFEISVSGLIEALGKDYEEIILSSILSEYIVKSSFLNSIFSNSELLGIYKDFKLKKYIKNEVVFNSGCLEKQKLVLIIQGGLIEVKIKDLINYLIILNNNNNI